MIGHRALVGAFLFFTRNELLARGETPASIQAGVRQGRWRQPLRGWYAAPGADGQAVQALGWGARLGCVSAIRMHGGWEPPDQGVHLAMPTSSSGRRIAARPLPRDTTVHWHRKPLSTGSAFAVAPLELAVPQLVQCQRPHFAVAVLDSLLHRRIVSRNRLSMLIRLGPQQVHFLDDHLDGRSEEGIESIVRFGLAAVGQLCDVQVVLRTDARVDLLIDDWLVIEADGRATHVREKDFTRNRVRAGRTMADGRIVLQFAYASIIYDLDWVIEIVAAVLRQYAPVRGRAGSSRRP